MKGLIYVVVTFASIAIGASDNRDLSGDVWKSSLEKRQTTWAPPSALVKPLDEVWAHESSTYNNGNLLGFKNYGYDIIIANKGLVKYLCSIKATAKWKIELSISVSDGTPVLVSQKLSVPQLPPHCRRTSKNGLTT